MATANPDVEEHVENSSLDGHGATSTINTAVKRQILSEKDGCGSVSEIGGQESSSTSEAVQKRIYTDLTALKEGNVSETRKEYGQIGCASAKEDSSSGSSHETWGGNYIPKYTGRALRIADSEGDKIDPNKNQHSEDASGNSKRKISNDKSTEAVGSKRNERKHRGIDQNWKTNDDDLFEEAERKYEYFWKNPSAFSQWRYSVFFIGSSKFTCAEQYMMYMKAALFEDYAIANKILYEKSPRRIKALGRKVHGFSDEIWNANCLSIVKDANIAKFSQNRHLKQALFDTYPKLLVEASPLDTIWGIGLAAEDPGAWDERTWCGKNYLGYVLTEVRDELMADAKFIADSDKMIYLPDLVKQMTKNKEKVNEPETCEGETPV